MGRSSTLNGASVALELLPRQIDCPPESARPITVTPQPCILPAGAEQGRAALAALHLASGPETVPLGPAAAHADLSATPLSGDCITDLMANRLPQALGCLLCTMAQSAIVPPALVYQSALALASLTRTAEAAALLALVEPQGNPHPAILALRGYLAFQTGDSDAGRKALARAALGARGTPALRGILQFTQHVLLTQQFGA